MRTVVKGICLLLGLLLIASSYAAELTEETVKEVMVRVDDAVKELNAKAIGEELSNSVSITININIQGHKQVMRPSKSEYLSMLEQGWAQYTNYEYKRSNLVIKVVGNKALVTAEVYESMTLQGQNLSGTSKEEATVELINGVPLITKVTAYIVM